MPAPQGWTFTQDEVLQKIGALQLRVEQLEREKGRVEQDRDGWRERALAAEAKVQATEHAAGAQDAP